MSIPEDCDLAERSSSLVLVWLVSRLCSLLVSAAHN